MTIAGSPLSRFSILLNPPKRLEELQLEDWIERGTWKDRLGLHQPSRTFTPFIGFGALQIGQAEAAVEWDHTVQIRAKNANRPELVAFYELVKKSGNLTFEEEPEPPSELTDVRFALLALAFDATQTFIARWKASGSPVFNWSEQSIALDDQETADRLIESVKQVVTILEELGKAKDFPLLGAETLMKRMKGIEEFIKDEWRLPGSIVEFCTQAFWHSMTFAAKYYPRYEELAFQVSLLAGSNYPYRRAEPPMAIKRTSLSKFSEMVPRAIERGEEGRRLDARDEFYSALAKIMYLTLALKPDGDQGTSGAFAAAEDRNPEQVGGQWEPPVALTTNFDLEFERALAVVSGFDSKLFHVAIPVYWTPNAGPAVLRWAVREFNFSKTGKNTGKIEEGIYDELRRQGKEPGWRWFAEMRREHLKGPLLMKLSGSPSYSEIKLLVDDGRTIQEAFPAILLDEYDFIQSMRADTAAFVTTSATTLYPGADGTAADDKAGSAFNMGFPEWLYESLKENRFWMLCGTRISDWTLRINLFDHLKWIGSGNSASKAEVVDVVAKQTHERTHLLNWLGVTRVVGDLTDLIDPLKELSVWMENASGHAG